MGLGVLPPGLALSGSLPLDETVAVGSRGERQRPIYRVSAFAHFVRRGVRARGRGLAWSWLPWCGWPVRWGSTAEEGVRPPGGGQEWAFSPADRGCLVVLPGAAESDSSPADRGGLSARFRAGESDFSPADRGLAVKARCSAGEGEPGTGSQVCGIPAL